MRETGLEDFDNSRKGTVVLKHAQTMPNWDDKFNIERIVRTLAVVVLVNSL